MNYARKEELRTSLVALLVFLSTMSAAVVVVARTPPALEVDNDRLTQATATVAEAAEAEKCARFVRELATESSLFQKTGASARLDEPPPTPPARPNLKPGAPATPPGPDVKLALGGATTLQKKAAGLATCRRSFPASGLSSDATRANEQLERLASLTVPAASAPEATQLLFARAVLESSKAPFGVLHTELLALAERRTVDARAAEEQARKPSKPVQSGLLPRNTAIGAGAGVGLLAVVLSLLSLRVASNRRSLVLAPMREAARQGKAGEQALAVAKLAAERNGGEPGLVMGAGVFALVGALVAGRDPDMFVAATMGGCVVGAGLQFAVRLVRGASGWRARLVELGELEKPALSMVLLSQSVEEGKEEQFVQFLRSNPPEVATDAIEKLVQVAEDRILAQAAGRPIV
jgi:hypothetical protein